MYKIENFKIYNKPQEVIITITDSYYLYNFLNYIQPLYLNVKIIKYQPHITLQNNIKLDEITYYPIDKIHKIYSYEGNLDIFIDSDATSKKLLSISEYGDTTIKGSFTTNDITIKGTVYDSYGNNLLQKLNNENYSITTKDYIITASNIVLNPYDTCGILINAQERNYTNNIFQINSGLRDNDANFMTLYSYTNGSYIHFTSHMKINYNNYVNLMYRLGMYDDTFGIWSYNLNDVGTLPGGYIDGRPSSRTNYTPAMTIKWNETTKLFDFNFNGSLNLNESADSYLTIGNIKLQNNSITQLNDNNNIISFTNIQNKEVVTIATNNVGINVASPDINYRLHIGGNTKVDGDIRTIGNVITASDKRYKTNINKIENALEKITKISGVTYNNMFFNEKRQSGLIAQEVNSVFPEVVTTDDNGYMSIAYGNMMGLIVESIKELKNDINIIKSHLDL